MFDWEGEELANIWGKGDEKEDHIVPYPDETYEKPPGPCGDHIVANATKLDLQHSDEKGQLDIGSQIEERDTSNFLDDNWGSFDDLDRILSNNENIFSIDSPSLQLGEHVETKLGFIKDVNTNMENMECIGGKNEKSAKKIVRTSPPYVDPIGAVDVAMSGEVSSRKMGTKCQKYDPLFFLGKECEGRYSSKARIESSPYKQLSNPVVSRSNQQLTSGRFSLMTPQEKIEKLRRRQQMRALLAIRKQQQEIPTCSNQTQIHDTLMMCSLEDSVLHQLENVISKLGIQIRVCIRDSLFRLSQTAFQRQYANEPNERLGTTNSSADGETKTNPIDRVVAHLLFHRPPQLSLQSLDSPSSHSKLETEGSSRGFTFFKDLQG